MILRQLSIAFALLCGFAFTQFPEFVQQYRQRLGGAVDELAADIARFDSDSARQGLSEAAGMEKLRANPEPLVKQRELDFEDELVRERKLRAAQHAFQTDPPIVRLSVIFTFWDEGLVRGTLHDFAPAVPTSSEAFVLGAFGFIAGLCLVLVVALPMRRRLRELRVS